MARAVEPMLHVMSCAYVGPEPAGRSFGRESLTARATPYGTGGWPPLCWTASSKMLVLDILPSAPTRGLGMLVVASSEGQSVIWFGQ